MANPKIRHDGLTAEGKAGSVYQEISNVRSTGEKEVYITNQEVDVASIQDSDSFAFTTGTVQINNLDIFDEFAFDTVKTAGAGADTISITTSKDGINFSGTKKLCLNTNTGNAAASVDMVAGDYVVPINCKSILITHSGSTDTFQFTWAARNAGRRRME